ncbi:MAG TPA: DUF1801 domain-containing protein, partial [Rhodanobacteraceae bacterium]|nr:DUF1801 domain-containing protein [Rhodanobacteraceae bacterium]
MAEKKSVKAGKPPSTRKDRKATGGFTKEEREAMRERAREAKSTGGESDVLAAIARMPEPDRGMATRLHAIIKASAPALVPKTWYGMPAYADSEGKVVCFFRNASKFKDRYATFGFNDRAKLDDGNMWPTAFALTRLTAAEEKRIAALVRKAA